MNPHHHIHIGLAFRAALIASALLLAAKSAGLAEEQGATNPDQAIVSDGSTGAKGCPGARTRPLASHQFSMEFPALHADSPSV